MDVSNISIVILCGGKGERLRPLTETLPKPLILIEDKPILHYLIKYFKKCGFKKFVIAAGYKAEKLHEYFKQNHQDLDIVIDNAGEANILQRIQSASGHCKGDFIVTYGDTLADINFDSYFSSVQQSPDNIFMAAYQLQSQFGLMKIDSATSKVLSFREKPLLDEWINIGYYFFPDKNRDVLMQYENLVKLIEGETGKSNICSYIHKGLHLTVNTIMELRDAEKNIASFEKRLGET